MNKVSTKQRRHLLKLAELKKGKSLSLETKTKISLSRQGKCKGKENHFFGRRHTKASINKMKLSNWLRTRRRLRDIFKKAAAFGFNLDSPPKNNKFRINFKKQNRIDALGYIIGTIPTDAYFGMPPNGDSYVYSISVKDKDFIETVIKCFKSIKILKRPRRQGNLWRIQTCRMEIKKFLVFMDKDNVNKWVFNERVFRLGYNFHRSLLMAAFDAEGSVTNSENCGKILSRKITFTNSSLMLIKQIKSLLNKFGIDSYIYRHRAPRLADICGKSYQFKRTTFVLIITGYQNLKKFKSLIGFSIKRKQKRLERLLSAYVKIDRRYTGDEYNLALNLFRYFSNCGDISRLTKIPAHTVRNWVLYNRKPRSFEMEERI